MGKEERVKERGKGRRERRKRRRKGREERGEKEIVPLINTCSHMAPESFLE